MGFDVKCNFGKQTSSQCIFECFGYSMENGFMITCLVLAMDFNACLMGFKINVNALSFAIVLA